MKPFFSVIIPLYNKEAFIADTLKSVLNQTFKDFEVIIIDDGSTDKSYEIALNLKSHKVKLFKQTNQGVSVARNFGIKKAQSNYIALLDADDLWYSNHLLELKKQIELFPNAGLYCNNYQIYYAEDLYRPANFNFKFKEDCLIVSDFFKASITNPVAWTSAVGFTKSKFNIIGGFNTKLKTAQDLDLWIRFALKYNTSFNPAITMAYKLHINNSLSKNEYNNMRYEFINSYISEEKNNPSLKLYLDINRYALAIRCLINNERELYNKIKPDIDYKNLNLKQILLLRLPRKVLIFTKKAHKFLINNKIYLTAYN